MKKWISNLQISAGELLRAPRTIPPAFSACGFTLFHSGSPAASPFASLAARAAARVRGLRLRAFQAAVLLLARVCHSPLHLRILFTSSSLETGQRPGLPHGCCCVRLRRLARVTLLGVSLVRFFSTDVFGAASRCPPHLLLRLAHSIRSSPGATKLVCRPSMAFGWPADCSAKHSCHVPPKRGTAVGQPIA